MLPTILDYLDSRTHDLSTEGSARWLAIALIAKTLPLICSCTKPSLRCLYAVRDSKVSLLISFTLLLHTVHLL